MRGIKASSVIESQYCRFNFSRLTQWVNNADREWFVNFKAYSLNSSLNAELTKLNDRRFLFDFSNTISNQLLWAEFTCSRTKCSRDSSGNWKRVTWLLVKAVWLSTSDLIDLQLRKIDSMSTNPKFATWCKRNEHNEPDNVSNTAETGCCCIVVRLWLLNVDVNCNSDSLHLPNT